MLYIQDRFTKMTQAGIQFSDAIILPKDEYEALQPAQVEALKTERFTKWQEAIATPPVEPEIPPEEKLEAVTDQLAQLQAQILELQSQKETLEQTIEEK